MVTIKVSNINKDNQFGGRNVNVSLGQSSFKTPNRTATFKEYNYAGTLPHNIILKNPISELILDFNRGNINNFLLGNGSFASRSGKIESSLEMMRQYPVICTIKIPTGIRIPNNKIKLFLELQNNDMIDIISLPPFNYTDIEDFKKKIIDYSEIGQQRKQETMPIIHMDSEIETFNKEFEALRDLHDNGLCNIIGFKYASRRTHVQQFNEVSNNKEESIWYHCFDVPRRPRIRPRYDVAHSHELQNWGIDTVSPMVKQLTKDQVRYLMARTSTQSIESVHCDDFFDDVTLGILKEDNWIERYHNDINCNCPLCSRVNGVNEFKIEYTKEKNGNFNPQILYGAIRIHELLSGSEEFKVSREAIKSDDLKTYFDNKEFTKGRIQPPLSE